MRKLRTTIFGPPRDPLDPEISRRVLLASVLAWIGFGANGLSAACYGPEKAYAALGTHTELGPFLALATALTVFVIALAYSQVLEIFPSGGGSYKIASQLLGPRFGLVSGSAQVVDYVLTIAVSLASGADALFSLLPLSAQAYKLPAEIGLTLLLVVLNLRGTQESIRFLAPVVVGFLLVHAGLILFGLGSDAGRVVGVWGNAGAGVLGLSEHSGWVFVAAIFVRAFALGGSTYTGVESISNHVNLLAEPRVKTGRMTMLYVALSLSFTAGGIVLLYALEAVQPAHGQTLNAIVFHTIIARLGLDGAASQGLLILTLALEGAILLVAANSILIFAPSLLGNMASDSWLPHRFRDLSSRLVREDGVIFIGACTLAILLWTHGELGVLVVFYSINVFLCLMFSKLGLCRYWWDQRRILRPAHLAARLMVATAGLAVALVVLFTTVREKFFEGGWATICLTLLVVAICLLIRRHYDWVDVHRGKLDEAFQLPEAQLAVAPLSAADPTQPTAIFLTTDHWGPTIHTLLWVQRLFPERFRNMAFLSAVQVEASALNAPDTVPQLKAKIERSMDQLEAFCAREGLSTARFVVYGTDPIESLEALVKDVSARFPDSVCFANTLILPGSHWVGEWLHNQTALGLQRRLHLEGIPLVILPIKLV
jgi:amino acid transporter